jgi:hypothetical protein
MTKILKTLLIVVLVTLSTWVAVLWRWDATKRDMSVDDVVIYLFVLPAMLVALAFALRWAWRAAAAARVPSASAAGSGAGAAATASAAPAAAEEARRHATVKLLSAHVRASCAQTPAELVSAAKEGKPRPSPFDELRGDDGMPVMCARIADLEPDAVTQLAEPAIPAVRQQQPAWDEATVAPHVWRALAALDAPLAAVLDDLQAWPAKFGIAAPEAPLKSTSTRPADHVPATVRMLAAWPTHWSPFEQAVATAWLRLRVTCEGATKIPASRFVFEAAARSGEELWLAADRLMDALASDDRHDVVVLAACDSAIGEAAVARLQDHGRLFSVDRRPKGLMPGEAAAALALAPTSWPAATDDAEPPVELHRASMQRRDKSIEADGRVNGGCLKHTVEQALQAARLDPPAVSALVCDADQHTARSTELFDTTLNLLPHLTPTDDMRLLGVVTAHTGSASPLLTVAAAAQEARSAGQPVLAVALGDAFVRLALVARVTPTPPESSPS